MIRCARCQNAEMVGVVFCSECGSQLFFAGSGNTADVHGSSPARSQSPVSDLADTVKFPDELAGEPADGSNRLYLRMLSVGALLDLTGLDKITVGRADQAQPNGPDVDLAPFKAFELGVSRVHVLFSRSGAGVFVTDLGSSNGTRLNGRLLPPDTPTPLQHKDYLSLGKLEIQILFKK